MKHSVSVSFTSILTCLFLYLFLNFVTNSSTLYKGVFHFSFAIINFFFLIKTHLFYNPKNDIYYINQNTIK